MLELSVRSDPMVVETQSFLITSVQSRSRKREAEICRDDEEFHAFMNLELDPVERQRIDALHAA